MNSTNVAHLRGTLSLTVHNEFPALVGEWHLYLDAQQDFCVVNLEVPGFENLSIADPVATQRTVRLHVEDPLEPGCLKDISSADLEQALWLSWWVECIWKNPPSCQYNSSKKLLLISATRSGYLVRNDVIQLRLLGWLIVKQNFSVGHRIDQKLRSVSKDLAAEEVVDAFNNAIHGVLIEGNAQRTSDTAILRSLYSRLSFPWIVDSPVVRRRLAVVEGGYSFEFRKTAFEAATALAIDLVILDQPGHWLQGFKGTDPAFICDFIPIDMTDDLHLATRIYDAIKSYHLPIDGITTLSDRYLCQTAFAAQKLSLPSLPEEVLQVAVDKAKTRKSIPLPRVEQYRPACNSGMNKEMDAEISPEKLIVKPDRGGGSQAVFLVKNDKERVEAEAFIRSIGKRAVIEPYLDGPEVDVNVVLHAGTMVCAEVTDNFPTAAEGFPSRFGTPSWAETASLSPSGLDKAEVSFLKTTIFDYLKKAGFDTGVFHCEARILNSKSSYVYQLSGYPRLRQQAEHGSTKPFAVAVIEINARPPGFQASEESLFAIGIDYYALQFLMACGDNSRYMALAHPISMDATWWGSGLLMAERGGVFQADTTLEELRAQSPELMKYVSRWIQYYKNGDQVADPGIKGRYRWVVWFLAGSDVSREHLEDILEKVRDSFRYTIV